VVEWTAEHRFRAVSTKASRYLWHPRVHEYYHETCHFFLITGENPSHSRSFIEAVTLLLRNQLDIESFTVNTVFGPYDVLLRVWLTTSARHRLIRALKKSHLDIGDVLEFTADRIDYGSVSFDQSISEDAISGLTLKIEQVVRAESRGEWTSESSAALDALAAAGLVAQLPAAPGYKFYMFFSEQGGIRNQPIKIAESTILATTARTKVQNVSLYTGAGFCDLILKGVLDRYEDILPAADEIHHDCRDLRLNSWTLVPADYGTSDDGETIDAIQSAMPDELESFLRESDGSRETVRREILSLDRNEKAALAELYRDARNNLSAREFERFADILTASLLADRKSLNQALSFLTSIEGDLRFVIPRLLAKTLGSDWPRISRSRLDSLGVSELRLGDVEIGDALKNWTLHQLLYAFSVLTSSWPAVDAEVVEFLPPEWRGGTNRLVGLRNDYTHSRLTELARDRSFTGELGERLRELMTAISFQIGLEDLQLAMTQGSRG
jgi:hypothetical protein